ncbi:enoyl-CoA hydratase [uncultured Erythrobacter sp.]|uniref:enoyl-CoA hydratase n=1 Tax=uncultured Erythrobacter sp. TaxID=263913 RepID=UPI0026052BD5|nr:enoyl-CoA hydratase [uncultured Erythrobacter sp.]
MTDHIQISTQDRVTFLTIARPDKKNAITQDMYAAMAKAIEDYDRTDEARAFIITGEGDMFTAGNDLQDFSTDDSGDAEPPVARFLRAVRDCEKPLIAAVNGPAIGVGLTMLLHCDLVYAARSATFGAPFVKLGLVPEAASSLLLPAAVGMAVANDILLAGRTLTADEAVSFGLVARVFADDELASAVQKIGQHVAASAPNALKFSKQLIRGNRTEIEQQMEDEAKLFVAQLKSPDFRESVAAMMEKRQPVYA